MQRAGELVDWVCVERLGEILIARVRHSIIDFSLELLPAEELMRARRREIYLLLYGFALGRARERIEQELQSLLSQQS